MGRSSYDVIYVATQFLEGLNTTVLVLEILAKLETWLQEQFKVNLSFSPFPKPPLFISNSL